MTTILIESNSREEAFGAAIDHLVQARDKGLRPVLLAPDYATALAYRRALAVRGSGFGIDVCTVQTWVDDLWQLYGDGSAIVDNDTRWLRLWLLLKNSACQPKTPGVLNLLEQAAKTALPYLVRTEQVTSDTPSDNDDSNTAAALDIIDRYRDYLHSHNLVEFGEALADIQALPLSETYGVVTLGSQWCRMDATLRRFFDAVDVVFVDDAALAASPSSKTQRSEGLDNLLSTLFRTGSSSAPLQPDGSVRFLLPTGPTAVARALADTAARAAGNGKTVCVVMRNPRRGFDEVGSMLEKKAIACSLEASIRIDETDIGRLLVNLAALLCAPEDEPLPNTRIATEYALVNLSGIPRWNAYAEDEKMRSSRTTDREFVLTGLSGLAGEGLDAFIPLMERDEWEDAFSVLEKHLQTSSQLDATYRSVQYSAISALRGAFAMGEAVGMRWSEVVELRMGDTLRIKAAQPDATVTFMDLQQAAQLEEVSYDCVILADLNADSYPVSSRGSALEELLERFGLHAEHSPLKEAQYSFFHAVAAARETVILERHLNNSLADELQPCVTFQETLDCFRFDTSDTEDLKNSLGMPDHLLAYCESVSESSLVYNAYPAESMRADTSFKMPPLQQISAQHKDQLVLKRLYDHRTFDGLDLSPSQIETYLHCPYGWFAQRRLGADAPDEEFGPSEAGTFMHAVLESFYRQFRNSGYDKVNPENLDDAQEIFDQVFDQVALGQKELNPGRRYLPLCDTEQRRMDRLKAELSAYLEKEAELLPTFHPVQFEWKYGVERPVRYAGVNITGSVDRIDVDDKGRAVVIDYKSSLSAEYNLFTKDADEESFVLPQHVQALIYSKVVRDTLGYDVVGALYVAPRSGQVRGAYDGRIIDNNQVLIGDKAAQLCRVPSGTLSSFDDLLDTTEALLEKRLQALAAGDIHPESETKSVCQYCPMRQCPARRER